MYRHDYSDKVLHNYNITKYDIIGQGLPSILQKITHDSIINIILYIIQFLFQYNM